MKENITHTQHTGVRNNSTTHLPLQKISQYYEQHINNITKRQYVQFKHNSMSLNMNEQQIMQRHHCTAESKPNPSILTSITFTNKHLKGNTRKYSQPKSYTPPNTLTYQNNKQIHKIHHAVTTIQNTVLTETTNRKHAGWISVDRRTSLLSALTIPGGN